jgi:hypothetical protein
VRRQLRQLVDPAVELLLSIAAPVRGGRRGLFVSQDAAEHVRQEQVLQRWGLG